jgi:hypothetical protein
VTAARDAADAATDLTAEVWLPSVLPTVDEFFAEAADSVGVDVVALPRPQFPSLDRWVEEWLSQVLRRRTVGGVHWCRRWWAHPEALDRLGALWGAWEAAQLEGGAAQSHWWLGHLEPHWNALTSSAGPFAACDRQHHAPPVDPLPVQMIPTTEPEPKQP